MFFSRPAPASAAVRIVAPPAGPLSPPTSPQKKPDTTKRECRNIHIYGSCKFEGKGCAFYHPPAVAAVAERVVTPPPLQVPGPETPSRGLTASAVNAPVFVPKAPPASPPPRSSGEYEGYAYGDGSEHYSEGGEQGYGALGEQFQGMEMGEYEPFDRFYPRAPFVRQPLNYHLYAPPPPTPPPSHFIPPDLRTELQRRSEVTHAGAPPGAQGLPEDVGGYHSLVPLESAPACVFRATGADGKMYVLRRVENVRLAHESALAPIGAWAALKQPNISAPIEAFTTRAFSDASLIFVTPYHARATTLADAHLSPSGRPPSERALWSYVIQLAGALRAAHGAGLALRSLGARRVLLTGAHRVRAGGAGAADVLAPLNGPAALAAAQQEDLLALGRLMLALGTGSAAAASNVPAALDALGARYSADVRTVAAFLCGSGGKHVGQVFEMLGSRLLDELDAAQSGMDVLESELSRELENGRIVRLLAKLGFVNERPAFARDARWAETGDRYILALFRDHVFHQQDARGRPVLDLAHVLGCLNKLDAGSEERVMLVSRDEQSVLVVSYRDVKRCVEDAFGASASASPSLLLAVSAPAAVEDVANLKVSTTVTNTGADTVTLLNTPESVLHEFQTDSFVLRAEASGLSPAFTGVKVKFAIGQAERTVLAPGESITVAHELAGVYNLTASGAGVYSVDASPRFHYLTADGSVGTVRAATAPASAHISGRLAVSGHRPARILSRLGKREFGFNACSPEQEAEITLAASNADLYVAGAVSYLSAISASTAQYTRWFGAYSAANKATVLSHYEKIGADATSSAYDCGTCTMADALAFVYPDNPGSVFLCPAFWPAPAIGMDSKAGTIVHEQSHFTVNGGTQDYVYGEEGAEALAESDPAEAIFNADSHEYFVESMGLGLILDL